MYSINVYMSSLFFRLFSISVLMLLLEFVE